MTSCDPLVTRAAKGRGGRMASLHNTIVQERHNSSAPVHTEDAGTVRDASPELTSRRNSPDLLDRLAELVTIREQVQQGPSARSTEQQRDRGKLTVRDRLELLFDDGSFVEIGGIPPARPRRF